MLEETHWDPKELVRILTCDNNSRWKTRKARQFEHMKQNATPKLKLLKPYKMINIIDSLKSQRWHITALNGPFTFFHTCQSPFLHRTCLEAKSRWI
jgi:hypothetical protein